MNRFDDLMAFQQISGDQQESFALRPSGRVGAAIRGGVPAGICNRATNEARIACAESVDDALYRTPLQRRLLDGSTGAMEVFLWRYAKGPPPARVGQGEGGAFDKMAKRGAEGEVNHCRQCSRRQRRGSGRSQRLTGVRRLRHGSCVPPFRFRCGKGRSGWPWFCDEPSLSCRRPFPNVRRDGHQSVHLPGREFLRQPDEGIVIIGQRRWPYGFLRGLWWHVGLH